ncbi:hypothetical protein AYI68_g7196, partial [Smittium mucronatum]
MKVSIIFSATVAIFGSFVMSSPIQENGLTSNPEQNKFEPQNMQNSELDNYDANEQFDTENSQENMESEQNEAPNNINDTENDQNDALNYLNDAENDLHDTENE